MREETISTKVPPKLTISPVTYVDNHDGDTFHVKWNMGVVIPGAESWKEECRLAHVNAAELTSADGNGKAAQAAVQEWLLARLEGTLQIWGREKYGRLLSDFVSADGEKLSDFVASLAGTVVTDVRKQLED